MSTNNLGRLQKVDLREAWESEARGFTPWLAQEENLKLLGEAPRTSGKDAPRSGPHREESESLIR